MVGPSASKCKPSNPDAILDVAVRVRERGYDGSTLDDVARWRGSTKASMTTRRSKEELLARGVGARSTRFAALDERAKWGRAASRLRTSCIARSKPRSINDPVALLLRVRGTLVERRTMARRARFTI